MITHGSMNGTRQRDRLAIFCMMTLILTTLMSAERAVGAADPSGSDLTAAERETIVKAVCNRIEQLYPFEEIGRRTREGMLRKLRAGEFDNLASRADFATRITADLEGLSQDKHLDLYYDSTLAAEITAREKAGDGQAGATPAQVESARWENFGFKALRMLGGQVGYLDLRMFFAARHAGGAAVAAMEFLSGSRAVIIDLRQNGGGWDDMVTLLASYFVDLEESEVVAITQSTIDKSYYASVASSFVPGKRLTGIPVYLLTSSNTASAAEAFASIVTHLNDNVITVGERTAGAENPVEMVTLDDRFVLKIPCYKKVYFGDRPSWEGTGLKPDVEVSPDQALETAHLHALRTLQERIIDAVAQEKLQWWIDGYLAVLEPKTVPLDTLRSYVGRYRKGSVVMEGGNLFVHFDDQPKRRLLAISSHCFLIEGRDDLRLRFVREQGVVTAMERVYSDGYRSLDMRH